MSFSNFQEFTFLTHHIDNTQHSDKQFAAPHVYKIATHANNTSGPVHRLKKCVLQDVTCCRLHSWNRKLKVWICCVFALLCVLVLCVFALLCICVSSSATVAWVQPSVPPMMEAMTIPRTTQHIIIIIFFCMVFKNNRERVIHGSKQGAEENMLELWL